MVDQNDDFVSFENALRDLQLRSEELKKLVSEGEIRAFRDGDSMKFRREDVESLTMRNAGEEELAFVDALEDDTGMVTEELSDEDTLLADDDFDDMVEEEAVEARPMPARGSSAAAQTRTRARASDEGPQHEPTWVTAIAVLGAVLLIWGLMITFSISNQQDPADSLFTQMFAEK